MTAKTMRSANKVRIKLWFYSKGRRAENRCAAMVFKRNIHRVGEYLLFMEVWNGVPDQVFYVWKSHS